MQLQLRHGSVRLWRERDAESLARHADSRRVWRNLRDAFPHPYSVDDARRFLSSAMKLEPQTFFCIADDTDQAVGSIGFRAGTDVERFGAELGYWLSPTFWGRGIMTEAVIAVTSLAHDHHGLKRVYALPFDANVASIRVLQKAGFDLEGRLRCSAFKDGRFVDQLLLAHVA